MKLEPKLLRPFLVLGYADHVALSVIAAVRVAEERTYMRARGHTFTRAANECRRLLAGRVKWPSLYTERCGPSVACWRRGEAAWRGRGINYSGRLRARMHETERTRDTPPALQCHPSAGRRTAVKASLPAVR